MDELLKEIRFDVWCKTCKHFEHKFQKEKFSFEAQKPCCNCLEIFMREGSTKPQYWEAK